MTHHDDIQPREIFLFIICNVNKIVLTSLLRHTTFRHKLSGELYFILGKLFVINAPSSIRVSRVVYYGCCVLLCSCIFILIEIDQIKEEEY